MPITELKWDARTVTNIPGNTAYWFSVFLWLTKGSRNKKIDIYIKQRPLRTYLFRYLVIRAAMGTGKGENIGKPFYFNLPPDIGFTLFTPIKGRIDSLTVYIYKAETCTNILRYNTCMSSYPGNGSGRKLSHNGCTAGNFDLPDHGFLLLTWSTGPIE